MGAAEPAQSSLEDQPVASQLTGTAVSSKARGGFDVLCYYFGAGSRMLGMLLLCLVAGAVLLAEVLRVRADQLLAQWAERNGLLSQSEEAVEFQHFLTWAAIAVGASLFAAFLFMCLARRSSLEVHERLLQKLVAVPAAHFDLLPAGLVLNHFSKDLDSLDTLFPQLALDLSQDLALLLGVVFVVIWATPPAALGIVPVLCFFCGIRIFFSKTARQSKRLDSSSRTAVVAALAEGLEGLATLRAQGQAKWLTAKFSKLLDRNGKAFFQTNILNPWCILTLDSMGAAIVCATSMSCVLLRESLPPGVAVLAISYSLITRGKLQFSIRLSVEVEGQMIAVERLQSFEASLPGAAPEAAPRSLQGWPHGGAMHFESIQLRYAPHLPMVLRGFSLEVPAGCRLGLAGRTGSGKSSLLAAILRMVELHGGQIKIDGMDISRLPLSLLRSSLAMIPQEPLLWSGTLAENLDPLGHASSDSLLAAMAAVGLVLNLDLEVGARGGHLSLGQRQLLCIARCLLRPAHGPVLLDEATSSVDAESEALAEACFREHLSGRTLLVVAHRLRSLLAADKVGVLEDGVLVELGTPSELLAQPRSRFSGLAKASQRQTREMAPSLKAPSELPGQQLKGNFQISL